MLLFPTLQLQLKQSQLIFEFVYFSIFAMNGFQQIVLIAKQIVDDCAIFLLVGLQGRKCVLQYQRPLSPPQQFLPASRYRNPSLPIHQIQHFLVLQKVKIFKSQQHLLLTQPQNLNSAF